MDKRSLRPSPPGASFLPSLNMLMSNWAQAGGQGPWGQPLWGLGKAGPQTPGAGVTELPCCPGKPAGPQPRLPLCLGPGVWPAPCPGLTRGSHLVLSVSSGSGHLRTPTRGQGQGPATHQEAFSFALLVVAYGLRDKSGLGLEKSWVLSSAQTCSHGPWFPLYKCLWDATVKLSQEPQIPGGLVRPSGLSPVAAPSFEQKAKKSGSCRSGFGSFRSPALSVGALRVSLLGVFQHLLGAVVGRCAQHHSFLFPGCPGLQGADQCPGEGLGWPL